MLSKHTCKPGGGGALGRHGLPALCIARALRVHSGTGALLLQVQGQEAVQGVDQALNHITAAPSSRRAEEQVDCSSQSSPLTCTICFCDFPSVG